MLEKGETTDFKISPTHDHILLIYTRVFRNEDGAYQMIQKANESEKMWLYVYEDEQRMVNQGAFYSMEFLVVEAKAGKTYLLRYLNEADERLVTLMLPHMVESNHLKTAATVEDVADHSKRIKKLADDLKGKRQELELNFGLEMVNNRKLSEGFTRYWWFSAAEVVLVAVIVLLQVEAIRRLLMPATVV